MRKFSLLYNDVVDLQRNIKAARVKNSPRLLVQIYSGNASPTYIQNIISEISSVLPDCRIIGATSSGEIYQGMLLQNTTILTFMQFEKARFSLRMVPLEDESSSYNAGLWLGQHFDNDPVLILSYACGKSLNAEAFAQGITSQHQQCIMAGGVATSNKLEPLVICNKKLLTEGAVAVAIFGEGVTVDHYFSPDWMMLGTPMTITESNTNHLISINDQAAKSIYARYLGKDNQDDTRSICEQFPLLTERNGRLFARTCKNSKRDGSIELMGNLETGESVRFGIVDPVSAMDTSKAVYKEIKQKQPDSAFIFPSIARKILLKSLTQDEAKLLQSVVPTTGMITAGQFFYSPEHKDYLHYAETVLTISEGAQRPLNIPTTKPVSEYSHNTLEMRALSHLVNTTAREVEDANTSLETLANTDPLTGIYNRRKMVNFLETEIKRSQRYGNTFSLIMFDVDDFKNINDKHGHQTGDNVLKELSSIAAGEARDTDLLSRWGGEEFLLLCPETNEKGSGEIAERIRDATEKTDFNNGLRITISVGVATHHPEDTLDNLLNRADKAMYHAKENGKNQVTIWE